MCSVFGALMAEIDGRNLSTLAEVFEASAARGRDSWGLVFYNGHFLKRQSSASDLRLDWGVGVQNDSPSCWIGNRRGEPTSEWVLSKDDTNTQPFRSKNWVVTHNGTIANDKELLIELGISTPDSVIDSWVIPQCFEQWGFQNSIQHKLKGSFALLAMNLQEPNRIYYATNYRPLFIMGCPGKNGVIFASQPEYFHGDETNLFLPSPREITPYSYGYVEVLDNFTFNCVQMGSLYPAVKDRVLVVCSGGLDSGTVAWMHHWKGDEIALWHLQYGCRAEGKEIEKVRALSEFIGCPNYFISTDFFKKTTPSVLTDHSQTITTKGQGEAGSEFAHEWVPARNTVMLALATAFAEAHGYHVIALGSNMEEAGAYPDNEPEFINKWRMLGPYAVKAYHPISYSDPCGNMVKHEIVRWGLQNNMPFHLTWSCYEGGEKPCGVCGPCFMRKKAFEMNDSVDPLTWNMEEV
jgi:7-cyano-7-deazaguanine synthase